MKLNDGERMLLRVYVLLSQEWHGASELARQYETKYHERISTQKLSALLSFLADEGYIQRRPSSRKFGIISTYRAHDNKDKKNV